MMDCYFKDRYNIGKYILKGFNAKMIGITLFVQFFIAYFTLREYRRIEHKLPEERLYGHEAKSFQDAFRITSVNTIMNIFFFTGLAFIRNSLLNKIPFCLCFVLYILMLLFFLIYIAFPLYMLTEVKHLSPNDGVNKRIKCKEKIDALHFYFKEFLYGLVLTLTEIILYFYFSFILGILSIAICVVLYILGMADILQHSNYNSPDHREELKQLKFVDRYYIRHIIDFFVKQDYQKQSVSNLKENTNNIKLGLLHLFL